MVEKMTTAGKQATGDGGLPASLAGMTKSQLYDIMSQMKTLIDQNQQQARQILIQNPLLTKALFQAQIMLGMVQPPQAVPKIEPQAAQAAQQPQQSVQAVPLQSNVQTPVSSGQVGLQEPMATTQPQAPLRKHPIPQAMPITSSSLPSINSQSQSHPSHPQRQGRLNLTVPQSLLPQSSQVQSAPPVSLHSASQPPPFHQPDIPASSTHLQHPMHSIPHMPSQRSLPPQPRPQPLPTYHHQYSPAQTGPSMGFQRQGSTPQPLFHSGLRPPASGGPHFPQALLPNQPPYQGGGPPFGADFSNQVGGPVAADRGSSWMSGPSDGSTITRLPGTTSVPLGQVGPGGGPPLRPASLTPEMEKALLQQVMSLTPEQISLLPPEQRNQVFQLQQMLRQ